MYARSVTLALSQRKAPIVSPLPEPSRDDSTTEPSSILNTRLPFGTHPTGLYEPKILRSIMLSMSEGHTAVGVTQQLLMFFGPLAIFCTTLNALHDPEALEEALQTQRQDYNQVPTEEAVRESLAQVIEQLVVNGSFAHLVSYLAGTVQAVGQLDPKLKSLIERTYLESGQPMILPCTCSATRAATNEGTQQ
jgi:hypothetical protein